MESTPKVEAKEANKGPKESAEVTPAVAADKPKRQRQRKPKEQKDPKDPNAEEEKDKQDKPIKKDQKPAENGTAEENKEDKPKKERRERPKKQDRPETAQPEGSKPLYRKKGETPGADDATPAPVKKEQREKKERPPRKDKEQKDETTPVEEGAEPVKKENRRKRNNNKDNKDNKDKEGKEPKYRPKGEKTDETPEDAKADGPTEGGEESKEKQEKKKEPDAPKNLIYKNPMDYKEKRKFKSKWEEYRHGDWRKGSGKTFVTIDTEIPEKPDKLIKIPEEKTFHSKQVEIEDKIKEITNFLEEKKTSFEEILGQKTAQMKAGDTGVVFSKELSQKFARMGELKKERQAIYGVQEKGDGNKAELMAIVQQARDKIDPKYNKEELIAKGLKEAQKDFQTSSGTNKKEQELIRRTAFLKESIPYIAKRDAADAKLKTMLSAKKEAGVDLPRIKAEMKKLQGEIDVLKEGQSAKTETKETFDKQLDEINARRKKLRDDRDKLYKQKEELRDTYYGSLIDYTKQQYLLQDIVWMSDMQGKIKVRKEEKDKRDKEYQERRDRIAKEREEKKQREEDKKQREADRKLKEAENKKMMEENLKSDEIEKLKRYDADIADKALKSSPLYEQIEQCEYLTNFCKKQMDKDQPSEAPKQEETKEEAQTRVKGELEKALKKGSIQLAPSKEEKHNNSVFDSLKTNKGKKSRKNRDGGQEGSIDFALIKKFNNLKISAPINDDDYERTIKDLAELRDALIYWGKIIQRQNKIKFIRNARKISSIDEYIAQAEEEEKYIENEKSKFDSDETAKEINISLEKLKMAQIIDRENRANKVWKDESEDEESEDEEEGDEEETPAQPTKRGAQVDLYGDDDNKKKKSTKSKKRRDQSDDEEETQVKQTKRPNAQKFKEIMKADDAFPTLENNFEDDEDDLGETPAGEINSQE